jgi:hypothetical protein
MLQAEKLKAFSLSMRQPVDEGDLGEAKGGEESPDERFGKPQAVLGGFGEPELESERADFNGVAVAQDPSLGRLAVGGDEGVGSGFEDEAGGGIEIDVKMFIPDAWFIELQITGGEASDPYRKTAGHPGGARLIAGKDLELNHQKMLRFTTILSPG